MASTTATLHPNHRQLLSVVILFVFLLDANCGTSSVDSNANQDFDDTDELLDKKDLIKIRPFDGSDENDNCHFDKRKHRSRKSVVVHTVRVSKGCFLSWDLIIPSPKQENRRLRRVSLQARAANCSEIAINGGPFQSDGTPVGVTILRNETTSKSSSIIGNDSYPSPVGFGLSIQDRSYVVGSLTNQQQVRDEGIDLFVSGFNWLVWNHSKRLPSVNPTGAKRAPRTAISIDEQTGQVLLMVVDGCERCLNHKKRGMTLEEVADYLLHEHNHSSSYAINLDGGSSTTMVVHDHVVNHPTCLDVLPIKCERPVSNVLCLSSRRHHNDITKPMVTATTTADQG